VSLVIHKFKDGKMNFQFENVKISRISHNIVDQIRNAIMNGEIRVGDRLPPESDFAKHFGVSKSSLREAYRVLEAYGLLDIRKGMSGGAFVQQVDMKVVQEGLANYLFFKNPALEEYTQIRTFIEPQIAKICAGKIKDKDLQALKENIEEMEREPEGEIFISDLDITFHKKLADIAGNSIISVVVESVQTALIRLKRIMHTDRAFLDMVCQGHREIVSALSERDGEKAGYYMLKHINEVEEGMRTCKNKSMTLES